MVTPQDFFHSLKTYNCILSFYINLIDSSRE